MTSTLDLLVAAPVLAIKWAPILKGVVVTVYSLIAAILLFIVLIQEGKGGGIAGAFGGAAAESFGVKAGTVNRFTAWLAALFIGLAVVHAGIAAQEKQSVIPDTRTPAGAGAGAHEEPPAMDGGMTEPAMDGGMTDGGMTDTGMGDGAAPPPAPPAPPAGMDGGMDAPPPAPPSPPAPPPAPMDETPPQNPK